MSSSMLTSALLRDSSDLHIYKVLYGERNKPEKKTEKLPLFAVWFLTDLERFSVV